MRIQPIAADAEKPATQAKFASRENVAALREPHFAMTNASIYSSTTTIAAAVSPRVQATTIVGMDNA
jgi:hypothetical protein